MRPAPAEAPGRREQAATWSAPAVAAVVGLAGLSLGLSAFDLGARSIWLDEGASIAIASQHGSELFRAIAHDGGNFAAYYLFLHLWMSLFGSGEIALRLPSALFGAACVPLVYGLGARLLGRRAGLYGAALTAVAYPIIYWGQTVRGYTLGAALGVASSLAFVRTLASGRRRDAVAWAGCSVLLCYTMLLAPLFIAAQLLSLFAAPWAGRARRQFVGATVAVGLATVPLGVLALHRGSSQLFWLIHPNRASVRAAVTFLAAGRYQPRELTTSNLMVATLLALVVVAVVLLIADVTARRAKAAFAGVFLLSCTAVMPFVVYVESRNGPALFVDRNFAPCFGAAALLVASVLARVRPAPLGLAGAVGLCTLRLVTLIPTYGVPVDDWRGATSYVLWKAEPGDCIAFYANDGFVDFSYYLAHPPPRAPRPVALPRSVLPAAAFGTDPVIVEQYDALSRAQVAALPASCARLWLIEAHDGRAYSTPAAAADHARFEAMRAEVAAAYSSSTVNYFPAISDFLYSQAKGGGS